MAVYTEVGDADLARFFEAYEIGEPLAFKGIAEGVENSNYLLQTTGGSYILTLYEKRVRPGDLPFFLSLLDHLARKGIACPIPVPARDGAALRELCGRPAAVVTFLQGICPRRIEPFHCRALGGALARLHLAGEDFPGARANDLSLAGWHHLFKSTRTRADAVQAGLERVIADELDFLDAHWPRDLPAGIIHADLFPDNVFFRGEELSGLIDFYFACRDFFAYDIAVCLNAWCFESDNSFNVTKARNLLRAYRDVRPFSAAELEALPVLARGASLRFLLTRLYDWLNHPPGAFVRPKDPGEYVRKLQFHAGVSGPGAYGLDSVA